MTRGSSRLRLLVKRVNLAKIEMQKGKLQHRERVALQTWVAQTRMFVVPREKSQHLVHEAWKTWEGQITESVVPEVNFDLNLTKVHGGMIHERKIENLLACNMGIHLV